MLETRNWKHADCIYSRSIQPSRLSNKPFPSSSHNPLLLRFKSIPRSTCRSLSPPLPFHPFLVRVCSTPEQISLKLRNLSVGKEKEGKGECWIKSISKRIGGGDESWNSTVKLLCSKSLRDANIKGEPGSRLHVQSKLTEAYYPIRALSSLSKGGKFRALYPFCLWFARSLFTHVQIGANPCTTFPGLMFALNRRMNPTESLRLGFALCSSNFRPRVCVFRLYKSLLWRFLLPASPFPMMFRIV